MSLTESHVVIRCQKYAFTCFDLVNSLDMINYKMQTYRKAVGMMKPSMILLGEVPDIINALSAIRLCKPVGGEEDI